jgi:IS4 transposase
LIAPHRSNRSKPATQDGRALRRYRRRWKVERLNAWLQNFRRIATRFEYHAENYLGFVHLGCIKILLRCYLIQVASWALTRSLKAKENPLHFAGQRK